MQFALLSGSSAAAELLMVLAVMWLLAKLGTQVQAGIVGAILLTTIAGPIGLGWALKRK
ncbi:MAG: hypothetical protein Q8O00_05430 [Holophaga sp.]|nr:hypothetical protein [Holophaga sp.]